MTWSFFYGMQAGGVIVILVWMLWRSLLSWVHSRRAANRAQKPAGFTGSYIASDSPRVTAFCDSGQVIYARIGEEDTDCPDLIDSRDFRTIAATLTKLADGEP